MVLNLGHPEISSTSNKGFVHVVASLQCDQTWQAGKCPTKMEALMGTSSINRCISEAEIPFDWSRNSPPRWARGLPPTSKGSPSGFML